MKTKLILAGFIAMAGMHTGAAQNASQYNNLAPINGINCAAFGFKALNSNMNSSGDNTALGFAALYNNSSGTGNTASGSQALFNNNVGGDNTAVGNYALYAQAAAHFNCAFGSYALISNLVDGNTAIGYKALNANTSGAINTALGYNSLTGNVSGSHNVGIGTGALNNNTTEDDNTALGVNADITGSGVNNSGALCFNTMVNASDKIRIGNTAITVIEGEVAFSTPSDGRFKTNISEEDVKGLAFIKKLRPVVYNFDTKKFTEFLTKNMPAERQKEYFNRDFTPSTAIRQSGFIAQEVEAAAKEAGYNFNGVHKPDTDNDNYSIAYSQFVVPLVKAVQEQQKMIEALQAQLAAKTNGSSTGLALQSSLDGFSMAQNVPNPFTHETLVKYNLPQQVSSAYMAVYDLSGRQIATFPITQKGAASLTITSDRLAAGIYIYSIVADGSIFDSKRMVVAEK